jgi:hypothetical protein
MIHATYSPQSYFDHQLKIPCLAVKDLWSLCYSAPRYGTCKCAGETPILLDIETCTSRIELFHAGTSMLQLDYSSFEGKAAANTICIDENLYIVTRLPACIPGSCNLMLIFKSLTVHSCLIDAVRTPEKYCLYI